METPIQRYHRRVVEITSGIKPKEDEMNKWNMKYSLEAGKIGELIQWLSVSGGKLISIEEDVADVTQAPAPLRAFKGRASAENGSTDDAAIEFFSKGPSTTSQFKTWLKKNTKFAPTGASAIVANAIKKGILMRLDDKTKNGLVGMSKKKT